MLTPENMQRRAAEKGLILMHENSIAGMSSLKINQQEVDVQ